MVPSKFERRLKQLIKEISDIYDDPYLVDPKGETDSDTPEQFDNTYRNNPDVIAPAVGQDNNLKQGMKLGEEEEINEVEVSFPLVNFGNSETMKGQGFMGAEFKGLDVNNPNPVNEDIENMDNKNKIIKALNLLPFKDFVKSKGGNIYAVGGVVRDAIMDKPSSDLDIVVTKVDLETLVNELQKYGSADFTGTDFGVIKFNPNKELKNQITALGYDDIIDIALPRADKSGGDNGGHKDIEAMVDPNMPIEDDLYRRDFTINSMALSINGDIVDPFNGVTDLKSGVIKWTNPEAFLDDPLRTVRAIRFAAVYGYEIDSETKQAIIDNRQRLSSLPVERFYMEFKKMEKKGGNEIFANAIRLINNTRLFEIIFKVPFKGHIELIAKANNLAEFFWLAVNGSTDKPGALFIQTLKGEVSEKKYIDALELIKETPEAIEDKRWLIFKMNKVSKDVINSELLPLFGLGSVVDDLKGPRYPLTFKELAVNGNDLGQLGLSGKAVGDALIELTKLIYSDKLPNDKKELLLYLNNKEMGEIEKGV